MSGLQAQRGERKEGNWEEDEDSARISVSALLSVTHAQSERECKNKSAWATRRRVDDGEIPCIKEFNTN